VVCRLDTIDARIRSRGKSDIAILSASCVADTTQVTPSLSIAIGAQRLADLGYIYGFFTSAVVYVALSQIFAAPQTHVKAVERWEEAHGAEDGDV
jgi:cytosine/uracil/thiamine/allantoin permease